MKYKGIKVLIVGVLVMSFMITGTIFATDKLEIFRGEYSGIKTEDEIVRKLASKTFDELLSEINILGDSTGENFIYHANALREKAGKISNEKIQAEILNESNSVNTRVTLIQISSLIDKSLDINVMQDFIFDDKADFEIKRNALLYLYKENNVSVDLIEKVSLGNDEELAFQAIKMLNKADPSKAIEIADKIIHTYNGVVSEKVRAAIKVKGSQLADSSTIDERIKYIDFCDGILSTNNSKGKGDIVSDTVIFSLSDIMSEETISYIVASDKIDRIAKSLCVEQNYSVLRSMLIDENISEKNLNTVIEAMYICPIKDMEKPLKKAMATQMEQSSDKSGQTSEKLQDVLNLIDKSGIVATGKY